MQTSRIRSNMDTTHVLQKNWLVMTTSYKKLKVLKQKEN
jgi:hypothetical protein